MSFQTQKSFIEKNFTVLKAEVEAERTISYVRLSVAFIYSVFIIYEVLLGSLPMRAFITQIFFSAFVLVYSIYFLLNPLKHIFGGYYLYLISIFDIIVITAIIIGYYINGLPVQVIWGTIAAVYFIPIIFTAFHHQPFLSLFTGGIAILAYTILFIISVAVKASLNIPHYLIGMFLLLIVTIMGGIVSRNNVATINKIISSEKRYHT
ncbi:MAG: hypothetical protein N2053_12710, partial [Chitinispirillaceae bacterium]|nr:hypothetical protein [Chitinispirillaceae bacterium]